jgi:DNA-binding PadR family transcriptional regulator
MARRQLGQSTLSVLSAVAQGYQYGFDIMDATRLQSGTVYRALGRLEDLGLVKSHWEPAKLALEEKRPRRRYYAISAAGRRELAEAQERYRALARGLAAGESSG